MNKAAVIVIFLVLFSIKVDQLFAQMQSSTYILETEIEPTPASSKPAQKVIPSKPSHIINGNGFTATLGSTKASDTKPFMFSISDSSINFGEIKPGEPLTRTQTITLVPGSANGFQVVGIENHPLRSESKHEIPNTNCDNGNCTNVLSDVWSLPLTYGFGYRCENVAGQACLAGINNTMYKRFSNLEAGELPSLILFSSTNNRSEAVIEYKINIPGNQPQDGYRTTINLLAVPSL